MEEQTKPKLTPKEMLVGALALIAFTISLLVILNGGLPSSVPAPTPTPTPLVEEIKTDNDLVNVETELDNSELEQLDQELNQLEQDLSAF
ncbi:MAG TPA: hypothetical protein VJC17_03215 [Candidatus Dojkabacteria bacterium]|nr:hypothetical protein [Candidatus Dojkabacteria bacterium]